MDLVLTPSSSPQLIGALSRTYPALGSSSWSRLTIVRDRPSPEYPRVPEPEAGW